MQNVPAISVVMAVYNGERYLAAAMDSILAQSFGDFEFIIIDDGSTDGSPAILQDYASHDPRIRLVTRPNTGLTRALNEALRLARGEYIARMDADDIADRERFALQIRFLRQNPQVVCLGTSHELIDGTGRLLTVLRQPLDDVSIQHAALRGRTSLCHPSAMMRREAVLKVGGYDESFEAAQDLDLWLRLGEIGRLANLADVLLKYRQHNKSISEKRRICQMDNMRRACELAWKRRGLSDVQFAATEPWRSGEDRESRLKFSLRYGWWAFNSAQRRTAIHYGLRAIASMPWRSDGWRLLVCSIIKPMPHKRAATAGGEA